MVVVMGVVMRGGGSGRSSCGGGGGGGGGRRWRRRSSRGSSPLCISSIAEFAEEGQALVGMAVVAESLQGGSEVVMGVLLMVLGRG